MQVRINGKSEEVQNGTVLDLLMMKKIEPQMVAVEVNDKVLERDHLATTRLNEGDCASHISRARLQCIQTVQAAIRSTRSGVK